MQKEQNNLLFLHINIYFKFFRKPGPQNPENPGSPEPKNPYFPIITFLPLMM